MPVATGTHWKRDEEIIRTTMRAMILRAGVLLGWLLLIVAICFSVLLMR
jgi:hypothetical protein